MRKMKKAMVVKLACNVQTIVEEEEKAKEGEEECGEKGVMKKKGIRLLCLSLANKNTPSEEKNFKV